MSNFYEKVGVGAIIVGVVGLLIFVPVLCFGGGYVGGLLLKWVVGNAFVNGVNTIMPNIEFTQDSIPVMCGVLAVIGSYFKATQINKKEK